MIVMSPQKLIAVRDPNGFRPLCIGRAGDSYVFASETCALDACGADYVRDVEPGEIVVADENGLRSMMLPNAAKSPSACLNIFILPVRTA